MKKNKKNYGFYIVLPVHGYCFSQFCRGDSEQRSNFYQG